MRDSLGDYLGHGRRYSAGGCLPHAGRYHRSRTIYWWLPVIVSFSLMLRHSFVRLLAQRGSPSFSGELPCLVWGMVLATTAAGTAAALVFAAPPLPDLERFATGVGGTVVLACPVP